MPHVQIVPAHEAHTLYLGQRLRASDVAELRASSGKEPVQALQDSLRMSDPDMRWAALYDGTPVALFGVGSPNHEVGCAWLLGSDELTRPTTTFLRLSREYVERMQRRYSLLFNRIDDRNEPARRWLEWLGFQPWEHLPEYGPERRPFTIYVREDHRCAIL